MPYPPLGRLRATLTRLMSPALFAYAISGAAAVASFAATLVLARTAGAAVVGNYALAISTANMLATLGVLGLDRVLLREIAGDLQEGMSGLARGKLAAVFRLVGKVSLALAAAYLLATLLGPVAQALGADESAMLAATIGVFVWPVLRLAYSGLRGAGFAISGQFFEALPTFLFTVVVLLFWWTEHAVTSGQITTIFLATQAAATAGAGLLLWKITRNWKVKADVSHINFLMIGLPILGLSFLQIFSEWVLLARISATTTPAEVGAFRVAYQVMTIAMVVGATTASYVSPKIAADFRAGRLDLMWQRHRRATILMLCVAGPFLLLALLLPETLMRVAFGPEFTIAATALSIMAVAQIVSIATGPIGALMVMAGLEKQQIVVNVAGLLLLLALSFTLIPRFGLTGAAIAYAVPIILRTLVFHVIARRMLPDHPAR